MIPRSRGVDGRFAVTDRTSPAARNRRAQPPSRASLRPSDETLPSDCSISVVALFRASLTRSKQLAPRAKRGGTCLFGVLVSSLISDTKSIVLAPRRASHCHAHLDRSHSARFRTTRRCGTGPAEPVHWQAGRARPSKWAWRRRADRRARKACPRRSRALR